MTERIGQGGTITLDAFYRDATGAAVTPTSPLVDIIDANGTVLITDDVPTAIGTGHYEYAYPVDAAAPLGTWTIHWTGTVNGSPLAVDEDFNVVAAGSITTSGNDALAGPCTEWLTLGDLQSDERAKRSDGSALPELAMRDGIAVACKVLWALTARQFSGVCEDMVRPCARFYRIGNHGPPSWWSWYRSWGTYSVRNPHREAGSSALHEITLGADPLREIIAVRINGVIVPADQYEIHDRRWLVRVPDTEGWPVTQNLYGDPMTDDNTFGVWFTWGQVPDRAGVAVSKTYAIELAKSFAKDDCRLPERIQNLQMGPGQSFALLDPMTFIKEGKTGLYVVDEWIHALNPAGLHRRSSVYNPDFGRPVRRTRTSPGS